MMVMMAVDREVVGVIMIMIRGGHADRGLFVFKAESLSKESDPQHICDWHDGRLWNTLCLSKYWGTSLEKHPAIKQPSKTSSIMLYRERLKK